MSRTIYGKSTQFDFTIQQGATFAMVMTWKDDNGDPFDLSSYTAEMQARASTEDSQTLFERSTEDNPAGIVLGGAAGTITVQFTAVETAALDFKQAVYDLKLIAVGGQVTRLLSGRVFLDLAVTR